MINGAKLTPLFLLNKKFTMITYLCCRLFCVINQHELQQLNMSNFIPALKSHRPCSSIGRAARRIMDNAPDLESGHCGFESRRVLRCRFKSCHGQPFCQDPSNYQECPRGRRLRTFLTKEIPTKSDGPKSDIEEMTYSSNTVDRRALFTWICDIPSSNIKLC